MIAQRNDRGQFVKGESGNPGGRKVADYSITELIDDAVAVEDWKFIFDLLKKKARRGDMKAIEMLMDRRWGKPPQENRITGKGGGDMKIVVTLKDQNGD